MTGGGTQPEGSGSWSATEDVVVADYSTDQEPASSGVLHDSTRCSVEDRECVIRRPVLTFVVTETGAVPGVHAVSSLSAPQSL